MFITKEELIELINGLDTETFDINIVVNAPGETFRPVDVRLGPCTIDPSFCIQRPVYHAKETIEFNCKTVN